MYWNNIWRTKKGPIRMSRISNIYSRQILDSRGNPTIYTRVVLVSGDYGESMVPSGASTGSKEALELRDNDNALFNGKSVLKAVGNINKKISPSLENVGIEYQRNIDNMLIDLDGTENKENLGANAILGVSMACARAGSNYSKEDLAFYLRKQLTQDRNSEWSKVWMYEEGKWLKRKFLPVPML